MIGNFIADFVKGKAKNDFPDGIRRGIELHRAIDDFTDHHHITSRSKNRLYPTQRKYAPVVIDMFYDHILAKNFEKYSEVSLPDFACAVYELMQKNLYRLPEKVGQFLPYMIEHNWLVNYSTIDGIARTLTGMGKRVSFPNNMHMAKEDLIRSYEDFENEFNVFFPELITFASANR